LKGREQEADPDEHGYSGSRKKYDEVKRLAEDRNTWRKMTHQPSDIEDDT